MCRRSTGWRRSVSSPAARSRSMNSRKVSVNGCAFSVLGSSAFIASSIQFGADLAHDVRPAHGFAPDELAELLGRHQQGAAALVLQALLELRRGKQAEDFPVQPRDDLR